MARENGRVGLLVSLLYPLILGLWGFAWLLSERLHTVELNLDRVEYRLYRVERHEPPDPDNLKGGTGE